ncbi:MAG TPA: phosphoglycerate kinase [Acidimicrobiales bacterium]|nr:phosphoglycerate kinase [Acidimicrobiales bacterium]
MAHLRDEARPFGMPVLEDLPDPAGARVLLRATLDLPLSSDPSSPLARVRADGLAETIRWLVERNARVTVWGSIADPRDAACRRDVAPISLSRVSAVLGALDPSLGASPQVQFASCAEDTQGVAHVISEHDLYVNDTLQDSLLPVPSVMLPPPLLPSAIGRALQRDLTVLEPLVTAPHRPFVAVLGGEQTFDRLHGLVGLVLRADAVLLGGGLALPMLPALGRERADGSDQDFLRECRQVFGLSQRVRHRLVLPSDLVWSSDRSVHDSSTRRQAGDRVVDIGPTTRVHFCEELRGAGCVLWAGSVGRVEREPFRAGTRALAAALGEERSVILGGDALVDLLWREGIQPRTADVLTATDSAIELLKNGDLPAIGAIRDAAGRTTTRSGGGKPRAESTP